MELGTIREWLKQVGDAFDIGDPLYAVESEKAIVEVEAKAKGTIAAIVVEADEEVSVGAVLAVIADVGESPSQADVAKIIDAAQAPPRTPAAEASDQSPAVPAGSIGGRETSTQQEDAKRRVAAAPAVRAVARTLGVDLATVVGSGRDGVITRKDVEDANAAEHTSQGPRIRERRLVNGIARSMAETVKKSWTEIPQYVQTVLVDVSNLQARRLTAAEGKKAGLTEVLIHDMAQVITKVPEVNASWRDGEVVLYDDINASVAVMADSGALYVPVIHRVQDLSIAEIGTRLRDLATRARAGQLSPDDMRDGTITLSNLGMGGVEFGTPLITPPQSAIVFVGAIADRPVAVEGRLEIRSTMYLSIAYDHRIISGALGAQFTAGIKALIEETR
jgi:pyruvate dehydrogenase E2 component (dihydrolipoyllysine-residue acetyltransferase)